MRIAEQTRKLVRRMPTGTGHPATATSRRWFTVVLLNNTPDRTPRWTARDISDTYPEPGGRR